MSVQPITTIVTFDNLEEFLIAQAEAQYPADNGFTRDGREYLESTNPDALDGSFPDPVWITNDTSYIWKVGILAQWDTNKFDHAYIFIGHERQPGRFELTGKLVWTGGENDDIHRSLARYFELINRLHHPGFGP